MNKVKEVPEACLSHQVPHTRFHTRFDCEQGQGGDGKIGVTGPGCEEIMEGEGGEGGDPGRGR